MNPFDHFVKEVLRAKYYLRYTDDFILLDEYPSVLASFLLPLKAFLRERLALDLHPRKVSLSKFRQGIDFLGYVVLPHYCVLRTKTKQRMYRSLSREISPDRLQSYLGLLSHCSGHEHALRLRKMAISGRIDV